MRRRTPEDFKKLSDRLLRFEADHPVWYWLVIISVACLVVAGMYLCGLLYAELRGE